jgi:[ribosomal protein S5]-alanine N-acetyltransferase
MEHEPRYNSLPFPKDGLTAWGVHLRPWAGRDAPVLVRAGSDPDILRFTSVPEGLDIPEALDWIAQSRRDLQLGRTAFLAVIEQPSGVCAGSLGLLSISWCHRRAEVGYWLLPEFRGKRLLRHGLSRLAAWAFDDVGMERLELVANLDNAPSCSLAASVGFIREGLLRSYAYGRYGREDLYIYSLLPKDLLP